MRKLEAKFQDAQKGAAITVKVTPRSKQTEFAEVLEDGTLKIKVAAAPEEGKANAALIAYLSETFGVDENQIEIVVGMTSEKKLVSLIGISPAAVEERVAQLQAAVKDQSTKAAKKPAGKAKLKK